MTARIGMTRSILIIFLTILWFYEVALCQEAVVTGPLVNIRSGPGTKHDIVAKVKQGDCFPILDIDGLWVQIEIDKETMEKIRVQETDGTPVPEDRETWIFRRLVDIQGRPPDFEERQIEFQNWALDEVPVTFIEFKSDWQIWVRLPPEKYASRERVKQIAQKMAREYRSQTGYMEKTIVVKVLKGNTIYAAGSN
jgi:hypothetical protein